MSKINLNITFYSFQEIHDAFKAEAQRTGREQLLLTSAVAAGKSKIDTGYNIPYFCRWAPDKAFWLILHIKV